MKSAFIKFKSILEKNYNVIGALSALVLILSFVPPAISWLIRLSAQKDVIVINEPISRGHYEGLTKFIEETRNKQIENDFGDKDSLNNIIDRFQKKSGDKKYNIDKDFLGSFIPFAIKDHIEFGNEIYSIEIQNRKKEPIKKVRIRIPGIHSISNLKIVSDALAPDEIAKLEKSWSINKDASALFFDEIREMPANSRIRIYIRGLALGSELYESSLVTYEGGTAKRLWVEPEYLNLSRTGQSYYFRFPTIEQILLITVFVLLFYQIFITKKDKS